LIPMNRQVMELNGALLTRDSGGWADLIDTANPDGLIRRDFS
jgi:hypothetical protein